ncbi:hypothetical protein FPSE5266_20297 [Fusarium pseudograminearum]|nr:hypothetical protein FPSE5266_20297 [Fusarium pseudograminearum]
MLGRAELATITLANVKSIPEDSRLGSYLEFLKSHNSVYSLGKADENTISEFMPEPIKANDGLVRDAWLSSGVGKSQQGKRVAYRSKQRGSRQPPPASKAQMNSEYVAASKDLDEAQSDNEDEDEDEDEGGGVALNQSTHW